MRYWFRRARISLAVLAALALTASPAMAGSGPTAFIFGMAGVGSGCTPPVCFDDASFHAQDTISPAAASVAVGEQVTFVMTPGQFHQVAIYESGTRPADVVSDPSAFPFVNDPNGRIFIAPPLTDATFTFTAPGKYLLICNIAPHLDFGNMRAWVNVR